MQNKLISFSIALLFLLTSCNVPKKYDLSQTGNVSSDGSIELLWNLNIPGSTGSFAQSVEDTERPIRPTSTPQLMKAINFEETFSSAGYSSIPVSGTDTIAFASGSDSAQWLYFYPAEYSTDPTEMVYAAFTNTGENSWNRDYSLEFYAGANPSKNDRISLNGSVPPGEKATFEIPVTTSEINWKACWHLLDPTGVVIYDFCYNHGNGVNSGTTQYTAASSGSQNFQSSHPFYKHEGSAPAKFSNDELSAEISSTSPASGHVFEAYDHFEELAVSIKNNGSASWDSSYALVFYSGYNWMHVNSFSISGTVNSGETTTIRMPMEIYEDNDKWLTCWYLATPDGKNLADFCFNYFTRS